MIMAGARLDSLTFAEFLDVAWAHSLMNSGSLANPFEYREVMKAHFGYDERTVEEVLAAQEAKRKADEEKHKQQAAQPSRPGTTPPRQAGEAKPSKTELDRLAAIMALAKPQVTVLDE